MEFLSEIALYLKYSEWNLTDSLVHSFPHIYMNAAYLGLSKVMSQLEAAFVFREDLFISKTFCDTISHDAFQNLMRHVKPNYIERQISAAYTGGSFSVDS